MDKVKKEGTPVPPPIDTTQTNKAPEDTTTR